MINKFSNFYNNIILANAIFFANTIKQFSNHISNYHFQIEQLRYVNIVVFINLWDRLYSGRLSMYRLTKLEMAELTEYFVTNNFLPATLCLIYATLNLKGKLKLKTNFSTFPLYHILCSGWT